MREVSIIGTGMVRFGKATLAEIRRQGYVHSRAQKMPGAVGIAAPLFSAQGAVFGSISVTIPEFRFDEKRVPEIACAVVEQARRLSSALGCRTVATLYGAPEKSQGLP